MGLLAAHGGVDELGKRQTHGNLLHCVEGDADVNATFLAWLDGVNEGKERACPLHRTLTEHVAGAGVNDEDALPGGVQKKAQGVLDRARLWAGRQLYSPYLLLLVESPCQNAVPINDEVDAQGALLTGGHHLLGRLQGLLCGHAQLAQPVSITDARLQHKVTKSLPVARLKGQGLQSAGAIEREGFRA